MAQIGAFLCNCGENITKTVDYEKLKEYVSSLSDSIKLIDTHKLLCSADGQKFLGDKIKENKLSHLLIVGCSPKQHEVTFQKVARESDLNPYLIAMVNIREQCAYVTEDPAEALEKAKKMVKASFERLLLQEPLRKNEIVTNPDAVVIGAGVAGIEAALLLAHKNRKVFLVEKNPNIGGMVTRQEELYPNLECATCMMEPKMDEIIHNDNIQLFTLSQVKEVKGFAGNFEVTIQKNARYVSETACFGCALCFEVCPVTVPNEYNENLNTRKAVYVPYQGALPFVAAVDKEHCLKLKGQECNKCVEACTLGAMEFTQKDEEIKINAGAIIVATGHTSFDKMKFLESKLSGFKDESGINERIYSNFEFERLIAQTGPTSGEIKLDDGSVPQSFAIIHCAGGRSSKEKENELCSSVCCMAAFKYNKMIRSKIETAKIHHIYKEFTLNTKYDMKFFNSISKETGLIRVDDTEKIEFSKKGKQVKIKAGSETIQADMVILMLPLVPPSTNKELAEILEISEGEYKFFKEEHVRINPSGTEIKGIYLAGTAQSPKDVAESTSHAASAAAKVLSVLQPGEKMELESITAVINEDLCGACKVCNSLCPYKAISFDKEKQVSVIEEVLCVGCGTCVAGCPSGCITAKHFKDDQILTEIREVL
ncbi:MAG: CoB--CoM heterodisulfide reductase iron-sulfur subunit A family protein [Spirochaetes bacterium]|nr:CoB--CoM heterodisulfide reductase iron-sulfur subunit A family protein [Spirochaetota bacterium]